MHEQQFGASRVTGFEAGRHEMGIDARAKCKIPCGRERIRGRDRDANT
jgi:hypothetical protein